MTQPGIQRKDAETQRGKERARPFTLSAFSPLRFCVYSRVAK